MFRHPKENMYKKPPSGIGRGKGRRRTAKPQSTTQAKPREMTEDEVLQLNIKATEKIAAQGLMPEGALSYTGAPEYRVKFFEAVDRIYRRLPEGYSYSFRERPLRSGNTEKWIQLEHVYGTEKRYDYKTGKVKTTRHKASILGSGGTVFYLREREEGFTQSALRGYAKAHLYAAAGKIYDTSTRKQSEKYKSI